jgi:hypothetical protein
MTSKPQPKVGAKPRAAAKAGAAVKAKPSKSVDTRAGTAVLRRDAEIVRLARALGVHEKQLEFLEAADEAALRELRLVLSDRLFELASVGLRKAASLASKIPAALAAKLAEHALGPVLSGRIVPLLDTGAIGDIAQRMPAHFLASAAVHLDLRHAAPLIDAVPHGKLEEAGAELARRREYVVLAAFVGHIDEEVLRGLLRVFSAETLLRAAFLVEEPDRIDSLIAHLDDDRLADLLGAAREHDLWEQAFAVFTDLGRKQSARVVSTLARLGEEQHDALAAALAANDALLAAAQPLLDELEPELRARLIAG